jgi:hypothetical protein
MIVASKFDFGEIQRNQMLTLPEELGRLNALKILDVSQVHPASKQLKKCY